MELKKDRKRHTIYRLPPCPAYDVEGMESWLTDMARRGWFLAKDGIFAGVATFESGTPCNAQYRLEAAQKSNSIWAEDGGEPDPEQVELSEKYTMPQRTGLPSHTAVTPVPMLYRSLRVRTSRLCR